MKIRAMLENVTARLTPYGYGCKSRIGASGDERDRKLGSARIEGKRRLSDKVGHSNCVILRDSQAFAPKDVYACAEEEEGNA